MKVILVNGSPHEKGCTYTALEEISGVLLDEGIQADIFWIGKEPISGCNGCHYCAKNGACVHGDKVNEFLAQAKAADGFVFGSPVHYAASSGVITSFLDRVFYSDMCGGHGTFYLKPGAAVAAARRAGTTAALDQLNKYFTIAQMPVISSQYWNMVHGGKAEQVRQDLEGLQIMRTLGRNMAWFLKCKAAGERQGVELPKKEERVMTNFIR